MTFNEYQKIMTPLAIYPDHGHNFVYPTLGLVGEAGEVAEKIKKVLRDQNSLMTDGARLEIKKELGDVLWYLSQLSAELGFEFDDIASTNVDKLLSRLDRGQLHGSGDNR